jgi:hypothetical protein
MEDSLLRYLMWGLGTALWLLNALFVILLLKILWFC